jgi:hypothetical protein
MTCTDARFAAGTGIEVHLEGKLFSWIRLPIRNQFPVEAQSLELGVRLGLSEAFNKRQFLLLAQQHLQ